jgi:hypothetical protein
VHLRGSDLIARQMLYQEADVPPLCCTRLILSAALVYVRQGWDHPSCGCTVFRYRTEPPHWFEPLFTTLALVDAESSLCCVHTCVE